MIKDGVNNLCQDNTQLYICKKEKLKQFNKIHNCCGYKYNGNEIYKGTGYNSYKETLFKTLRKKFYSNVSNNNTVVVS